MITVSPGLAEELRQAGIDKAVDCFNCGTCTAICPLIYDHFPRTMIRYIQLGAKDRILENPKELWRCLHCGLCTQTCPREADPGEIILGLKRLVVTHWRKA